MNPLKFEKYLTIIEKIGSPLANNFVLTESDLMIYKSLLLYFHGSPEFEKIIPGYSLKKGLIVRGGIGTGKTTLFKVFKIYYKQYLSNYSFHLFSTTTIVDNFIINGAIALPSHGIHSFIRSVDGIPDFKQPIIKCYDDLGVEPKSANHFGNARNVIADIFLKRYDLFMKYGMRTFISTNLSPSQIEKFYGQRVRSRLREMCNEIIYEGEDRRR